jgi:hypothetical protein
MTKDDFDSFASLLTRVYSLYGKPFEPRMAEVWFNALSHYTFEDFEVAINRHLLNPESGRFVPLPADVVRVLDGGTGVQAAQAWSKVEQAIKRAGPWRTVIFDDAIIHRVLEDMGGWKKMNDHATMEDLKFAGIDFGKRYQGYVLKGGVANEYPAKLLGYAEAANSNGGFVVEYPLFIGVADMAAKVGMGGREAHGIQVTKSSASLANLMAQATKRIGNSGEKPAAN